MGSTSIDENDVRDTATGRSHRVVVFEPHGWVELEDYCASDLAVVNAARVSFAKHSVEYSDNDARVLRFLMRQHHGTPFEHNYLRFHVRAPIFVFWDWKRHRIASYNVESARYTTMRPDFYIPDSGRIQLGKPGDYSFGWMGKDESHWLISHLEDFCELGWARYEAAIERGYAKEQARLFLPMNLMVEFYFSVNARSLMNFLALRNERHALYELQEYARAIEQLWSEVMPDTAKAFQEGGRVVP